MEQKSRQQYEAYRAFMMRHHKVVWRVCYDFALGDEQRCKDMVQEVWIMVWLKFDQLREDYGEWKQRAWLRKVTKNVLVSLYRREIVEPLSETSDLSNLSDLPDESENRDSDELIDHILAALTPDERHLMRMRLDGYNAEEIAAEFNIEPNAVYQRINRIMKKLRKNGK